MTASHDKKYDPRFRSQDSCLFAPTLHWPSAPSRSYVPLNAVPPTAQYPRHAQARSWENKGTVESSRACRWCCSCHPAVLGVGRCLLPWIQQASFGRHRATLRPGLEMLLLSLVAAAARMSPRNHHTSMSPVLQQPACFRLCHTVSNHGDNA